MLIKKANIFILFLCMTLLISVCTGCMDMGAFEDDEDYYGSFGTITLYDQGGLTSTFSLRDDFYNAQTVENMKTSMESGEYIYFLIGIEEDIQISEMHLYVKSDTSVTAQFSIFILNGLPSEVPSYESVLPIYGEDDPLNSPVATARCALNANMWDSFGTGSIGKTDESGKKTLRSGDFICVRFDNNTSFGKENGLKKYGFVLTNFIVRAI